MNMIMEQFGGSRVAAIFRNYAVALLLAKQLVFALFFIPIDYNPKAEPSGESREQVVTAEPHTSLNVAVLEVIKSLTTIESAIADLFPSA